MAKNSFTDWDTTANNNTDVAGVNIAEGCAPSGINNAIRAMMAQLKGGVDGKVVYAAKGAGYTAVAADNNAYLRFTAGATLALTAAATLGTGWHCYIQANGGAVVIDPNSTETVNGATTVTIADGQSAILICTGSAFFAYIIPGLGAANTFTASNTFTVSGLPQFFTNSGGSTAWDRRTVHLTGSSPGVYMQDSTAASLAALLQTDGSLFRVYSSSLNDGSDLAEKFRLNLSTGDITTVGSVALASNAAVSFSGTGAATTRTNLGALAYSDLVYTGTSASNTSFPISTTLCVLAAGVNRNATSPVYIYTGGTIDWTATVDGAQLAGTWNARGLISASRQLFQRTA